MEESLRAVACDVATQRELLAELQRTLRELAAESGAALLHGGFEAHVRTLSRRCAAIDAGMQAAFFRSRRPTPGASGAAPDAALHAQVPQ
jgi:hypothetical protein